VKKVTRKVVTLTHVTLDLTFLRLVFLCLAFIVVSQRGAVHALLLHAVLPAKTLGAICQQPHTTGALQSAAGAALAFEIPGAMSNVCRHPLSKAPEHLAVSFFAFIHQEFTLWMEVSQY